MEGEKRGDMNSSLKVILKILFLSNQGEDKKYQFIAEAYGRLFGNGRPQILDFRGHKQGI
jgi:hypothetical protein